MSKWRERGYVRDSDDEESQENCLQSSELNEDGDHLDELSPEACKGKTLYTGKDHGRRQWKEHRQHLGDGRSKAVEEGADFRNGDEQDALAPDAFSRENSITASSYLCPEEAQKKPSNRPLTKLFELRDIRMQDPATWTKGCSTRLRHSQTPSDDV